MNTDNLDKEFLPFVEAKALKELGFNDACLACYMFETQPNFKWELHHAVNTNKYLHIISAPLYSQAFDFFREKYNLYPYIHHSIVSNNARQCTYSIISNTHEDMTSSKICTSYKKAELKCLQHLIKFITKNKENEG